MAAAGRAGRAYTGDALYAVAVFWALIWVAPAWRGRLAAAVAFSFSALVEICQLLEADWLRELQANRLAALLLGQGFQRADLIAYAAGAMLAMAADWALRRWRPEANP